MGFWEEKKGDKQLIIGDEPIDLMINCFEEISRIYEEEVGRKPTINEIEMLIQMSLEHNEGLFLSDMEGYQITDCKIKTKKAKKVTFKPGDVFAIPLNNGEVYGYGMVVKGTHKPFDDVYIEYYKLFTKDILTINKFRSSEKEILFTANSGTHGIFEGIWKKIGSVPFDESKYQLPDFYGEFDGVYYISKGISNEPSARIRVSKEEAERVKNPDGIIGSGIIAKRLYKEYLKLKESTS